MEKEKQVEKIQLEYDLFTTNGVEDIDYIENSIMLFLDEMDVLKNIINVEKHQNRKKKLKANRLGKKSSKYGLLDVWYYDKEFECLKRQNDILGNYFDQLDQIYGELNDNNFQELNRLLQFTRLKNLEYEESVKEEKKLIMLSASGESFERAFAPEESEAFKEFFDKALTKASYVEKVEKVKK